MAGQRQGLLIMQSARCPGQCREKQRLKQREERIPRRSQAGRRGCSIMFLAVSRTGQRSVEVGNLMSRKSIPLQDTARVFSPIREIIVRSAPQPFRC